jgi:hypothetical protein
VTHLRDNIFLILPPTGICAQLQQKRVRQNLHVGKPCGKNPHMRGKLPWPARLESLDVLPEII